MVKARGFTLIEVLVALAIVAIAMTAIIKATGDSIRTTAYLKQKTTAYWVAMNVLNDTLAGAQPGDGETKTGSTLMLNHQWPWELSAESTGNARIHKLFVRVFSDDEPHQPRVVLTSYA
ncbi:MAG TPA: type II secretion system minor pseudopilin GspI [Gammaproteobacteria bacterium]|nr:type II secretion system minor pseudopilin GspI [Gammaproteobacteria bacterium]